MEKALGIKALGIGHRECTLGGQPTSLVNGHSSMEKALGIQALGMERDARAEAVLSIVKQRQTIYIIKNFEFGI